MCKLSERIKKADELVFVDTPGLKSTTGSTWGKNGRYTINLFQKIDFEQVEIADMTIDTVIISTSCEHLNIANGELSPMENCKGNSFHTVCYHSLGYLKHKLTQRNKSISYCENILDALNVLRFGGQLTKIISKRGDGYVWSVVRDKEPDVIEAEVLADDTGSNWSPTVYLSNINPEHGTLSAPDNINLMRGSEDDEGID